MTDTTVNLVSARVEDCFNVETDAEVKAWPAQHEFADRIPAVNAEYAFRSELLSDVLAFSEFGFNRHEGMFLFGHAGTGKSTLPAQIAARLNVPFWTIDGNEDTELSDLLGQWVPIQGSFVWVDGPVTAAFRAGGWVCIEEGDRIRPQIMAALHAVIDGGNLTIAAKGGETLVRKDTFALFVTGNSNGSGSDTGDHYVGPLEQDLAFLDRFQMVEVPYLEEEDEIDLLDRLGSGVPRDSVIAKMVRTANDVRSAFIQGESPVTFSTRTLLRWLRMLVLAHGRSSAMYPDDADRAVYEGLKYSLDRALALRIGDPQERQFLYDTIQRNFGIDPSGSTEEEGES